MKPLCTKPPRFTAMFTWPMKISGHKTRQQNQDATRWRGKAQKRSGPCRRMVMSPILCMSRTQKSCKLRNKTATSCTEDSAPWQILHFLLRHPLWENSWLSLAMRTIWILVITGSSCSQGYPSRAHTATVSHISLAWWPMGILKAPCFLWDPHFLMRIHGNKKIYLHLPKRSVGTEVHLAPGPLPLFKTCLVRRLHWTLLLQNALNQGVAIAFKCLSTLSLENSSQFL